MDGDRTQLPSLRTMWCEPLIRTTTHPAALSCCIMKGAVVDISTNLGGQPFDLIQVCANELARFF